MKQTLNLHLLLIVVLAATGCGKKDASLLELVPASPIVNPNTRVLIKDNALIYAEMGSQGIRGFNRTHSFTTPDGFQSFTIRPYTRDNYQSQYRVQGNRMIFWNKQTHTPFTYSLNFGQSWQTLQPEIEGTSAAIGHFYGYIEDFHFINDNNLLLFNWNLESSGGWNQQTLVTRLYKVDLSTGKGSLYSAITNYMPVKMHFQDSNTGWLHLTRGGRDAYIAKTTDGGLTWSTPVLVEAAELMTLAAGSDGYLFFYNSNGLKYASANGGATWTKLPTSPRISDVVVINASSLLAVSESGFVKSTDGGSTWNFQSDKEKDRYRYGKISFRNEKEGIIYQDQSMYQTTDGGATWQPLLNTYPYIIN